ncbi:hypothetical protein [Peribacillus butanolivorans]
MILAVTMNPSVDISFPFLELFALWSAFCIIPFDLFGNSSR